MEQLSRVARPGVAGERGTSTDQIDTTWLEQFDQAMLTFYAIDHVDAGMDEATLLRYCDLTPREAALVYGEDYDLHLVDAWWPRRGY